MRKRMAWGNLDPIKCPRCDSDNVGVNPETELATCNDCENEWTEPTFT